MFELQPQSVNPSNNVNNKHKHRFIITHLARFTWIFDETFDYAQGKKDAKWFGCIGKTEEKLAFLLALAMH